MTTASAVRNAFEFAPSIHFLKIEPNDKCPLKGSKWRKNPLSEADAVDWVEQGHRLGVVPATAGCAVVDIDTGGVQSLAIAGEICGDPVAIIETGSHTVDNPRWHAIYSHDPADKIGNAKWLGGDLRVDAGYVVCWDLKKWADAIARIKVQAIPPAPIAKLKTAQAPSPTGSLIVGQSFGADEGLHPQAVSELGRAIAESETWDECAKRCDAVVKAHAERRRARDGDNPKTDAKLKSEMDAWNKAVPQWWREKQDKAQARADDEYALLPSPHRTRFPMSQPGKMIKDLCKAIGIEFRTNITRNIEEIKIEGYTLDQNGDTIWKPLDDGLESSLPMIFEWNAEYLSKKDKEWYPVNISSKNARLQDYIRCELSRNIHHPFREYLDGLPDWDGCGRIDRLLNFLGLKIDIDPAFERWAHTYLVIDPIRLNLFPGSERKTHLVLSGGTNTGKSQLGKRLFPEHLASTDYQNDGFVFTPSKTDQMYQVLGYILCEGSEFTGGDIQSIRQAKAFLSQPGFAGGRVRYAKRAVTGYRSDCIYFTSNDRSIIPPDDLAMDGRLIIAIVNGQCEHDGEVAFPILDQLSNPEHPERGTIREQIWAEAYRVVKDAVGTNSVVRNPYLPSYELATKAQAWNAGVGAHYSTEMTTRREVMTMAIDEMGNPSKIEMDELIKEMYRAETGDSVVQIGDKPDYALEHYKRQNSRHKIINGMAMLGYRWVKGRWEERTKWLFHNGKRSH